MLNLVNLQCMKAEVAKCCNHFRSLFIINAEGVRVFFVTPKKSYDGVYYYMKKFYYQSTGTKYQSNLEKFGT